MTQPSNVLFYEEKENYKKVPDPDLKKDGFLHRYELTEIENGKFVYQYRGIV